MYTNGKQTISGKRIEVDGRVILNPTEQMLADAGWVKVEPHQPSDEELSIQVINDEIEQLRTNLYNTDYIPLKYIEGYNCDELYPNWKEQRKAWRDRINELEQ